MVCGATEHPCADVVAPEGKERLEAAKTALAAAKGAAQTAQNQMQVLTTQQIQTKQNKRNTAEQIEQCDAEIAELRNEITLILAQWQRIYADVGISSEWTTQQIEKADTVIVALTEAEQIHTQVSHAYQTASQQLETCEKDITRETKSLSETKEQLQKVSNTLEDLRKDIAATEESLWKSLPDAFHGTKPKAAVAQFDSKIKDVETFEDKLRNAETQLQLLSASIETDRGKLEALKERHKALQTEIEDYQRQGERFLKTAKKKTGGLGTEEEINAAVNTLNAALRAKEKARDKAQHQLQKSLNLATQQQTTYRMCEQQHEEWDKKFETARQTYFAKLDAAAFDAPAAHDNAFRTETQIQELTHQIDTYGAEKQQLALEITELRTRFEGTPFDQGALERIEAQAGSIEAQTQAIQQEIGAQQQKIDDLKDALKKREALGNEQRTAQQELERWQRLQNTIPQNTLRDFALEIMFKQMGDLANQQLRYLTSERYQLKVETIGNLTVIDRWNANEERPVETLSGGESFLTSLALALALSELSRGRAQLNSLFLDEGFGTLDTETLDIAIAALEGLRMQGRSIFLISHIQELTRRLPVKINVRKRGNGSSSIQVQG